MLTVQYGSPSSLRIFCLLLTICWAECAAQTVQGTVRNGTVGKPQSGDLILLITGAQEIGRAVSDKNGDFQIKPRLLSGSSLGTLKVRVLHDRVSYEQPIRLGVSADVRVYGGEARVDGLSEYLSIFQFEARTADRVAVTELHAIQNDSWPPRTSTSPDSFNLSLPKGARNLFVTIAEADGQAAKLSIPDPSDQHGPYKFGVPLKPGLTKYVFSYELPYRGMLPFRRGAQYSTKKTFIVLPMSMHLTPLETLQFHEVPDKSGTQVREIDSLAENDILAFQVSGTGVLAQAFQPISGSGEPARETEPARVEPPPSNRSLSSSGSASNKSKQKASPPAAPVEPISQPVRNWTGLAFVLFTIGTLLAWKVSRAKSRRGS